MAYPRAKKAIGLPATPAPYEPVREDAAFAGPFRAIVGPQGAPPEANNDAFTTNDLSTVSGNLLANDTPGDLPLAVAAVNGSGLAVDREIILPSGARLRVNADGSFTYNPNGAFNSLPTANDMFTYTVAGGDTATVTVTVEDPPNPNVGTDGPETLNGTPGDDVLDARGGDDVVNGLGGNDSLDGGTGADSLVGGLGNDTYLVDNAGDTITELDGEGYDIVIATANYTLAAGVYVEELTAPATRMSAITLTGNALDNIITGAGGPDHLNGGGGNDELDGGPFGGDTLNGGTGNDILIVGFGDSVVELDGEGYDIVYYRSSFTLTANAYVELIAPLPTMFLSGVTITGNALDNLIHGTNGHDTFIGNGGNDTLIGFGGNDSYYIGLTGHVIVEEEDGGNDTILTSFDHQLSEAGNIENLVSTSSTGRSLEGNSADNQITGTVQADVIVGNAGHDTLKGLGGNDSLYGDAGNDILNGGTGADLMDGGVGNDSYTVDNVSDVVIDNVIEAGQDRVNGDQIVTTIDYTLAADQHIEALIADSIQLRNLTGNDFAQLIRGTQGSDTLIGLGGDDLLFGLQGNDTTDGGFGDDIHYVDSLVDVVVERVGEGRDTVYTRFSYGLAAGVEVEVFAAELPLSVAEINLVGNAFDQEIYGNAGANLIDGGGGTDLLAGQSGDDTYYVKGAGTTVAEQAGEGRDILYVGINYGLGAGIHVEVVSADSLGGTDPLQLSGNELNQEIYGNAGANSLRGGGGSDLLLGGFGDDDYYITSGGETIFEYAGQGRDIIYTGLSHNLAGGSHVEILSALSLSGTDALNFGGNELDNVIYGNAGTNILYGGGGLDTLVGGNGDDTYYILGGNEALYEGAGGGRDIAYSFVSYTLTGGAQVEILSTSSLGGTDGINLTGNEFGQEIDGNNGVNTLDGKSGNDVLIGYGGADTFAFTSALGAGNVDTLADFASGADKIALDNAVFTGLADGPLPNGAFATGAAATELDDRIVYNSATGQIFFDADGSSGGAAVQFASVASGTILIAGDFTVI